MGAVEQAKSVTILGVTGSIGNSALAILDNYPESFRLKLISADRNYQKLCEIALKFKPEYVVINDESNLDYVKASLANVNCEIISGQKALELAVEIEVDIAISAIVGIAALTPTLKIISKCGVLGLANKESLVCAASFLKAEAKKYSCKLIPLDSEHNSIFRIFDFAEPNNIEDVTITASGGPFLNLAENELSNITPKEALSHPSWNMGAKISIDSATMMNKALELIETYNLFPLKQEQIKVIIHPESIFHAFVKYIDGSVKALLHEPDMRTPISLVFSYPNNLKITNDLDFLKLNNLHFYEVDRKRFEAIDLAYNAIEVAGTYPVVMNSANEVLVSAFLEGKVKFNEIIANIKKILEDFNHFALENIDDIYSVDQEVRLKTQQFIRNDV